MTVQIVLDATAAAGHVDVMVSPVEHQMTVESPTNGQPPAAAAAATSAERDSLPQLRNGRWIALGADEATFGSMVGMRTPTPAARW